MPLVFQMDPQNSLDFAVTVTDAQGEKSVSLFRLGLPGGAMGTVTVNEIMQAATALANAIWPSIVNGAINQVRVSVPLVANPISTGAISTFASVDDAVTFQMQSLTGDVTTLHLATPLKSIFETDEETPDPDPAGQWGTWLAALLAGFPAGLNQLLPVDEDGDALAMYVRGKRTWRRRRHGNTPL